MYTVSQIEKGIGKYVDLEILPLFDDDSVQKLAIGVGVAIYLRKKMSSIISIGKGLGIVDDNNNVDLDILKEEVNKRIPETGISYDTKILGKLTFTKDDVNKLMTYIKE